MAKRRRSDIASPPPASQLVENPSLSLAARTGKPTEDELLLQRPKQLEPVPRVPEQAEFTRGDRMMNRRN